MKIIQEISREKNCNGLIIEDIEAGVIRFSEEETAELHKFFNKSHYGALHREGIWLVKSDEHNGIPYLRSTFLDGISDDIKAYPFINVEKYRNEIETAIIDFAHSRDMKNDDAHNILNGMCNAIINSISKKILSDKEKHTLTKEDFYENF